MYCAQDRSALSGRSPTNFSETGVMQRNVKMGQSQTTPIENSIRYALYNNLFHFLSLLSAI